MPQLGSFWLRLLPLFVVFNLAFPQSIIKALPGYNGTLPFKLETGYIGVGEDDEIQLFYYFIESERDAVKDPLVLWHTGGPGCSGFSSLVYEHIGPLSFDVEAFDGSLPSFLLNPYSWTKVANIIFLDSPVGTGFSYSTTSKGYYTSDTKIVQDTYVFLQKWLLKHPNFMKNRLYIAGDSFGGKIVPMIATHISRENEAFVKPRLNLKGYFIGNPGIEGQYKDNGKIPYAYRLGLISDQYYKLAESSCDGKFVNPDPNNYKCLYALQLINTCIENIYLPHILEPNCVLKAPRPNRQETSAQDDSSNIVLASQRDEPRCRDYDYVLVYVWANDPTVQEALHIRKGTKRQWIRCNKTSAYQSDVDSAFPHNQYLSKKNYEALVYSGDHDMVVPYLGTLKWIHNLNLTLDDNWRPWFVNGQVAGYTEKYQENRFSLTFATVKGAGHTASEYKPKECFAMIDRWLSGYAL